MRDVTKEICEALPLVARAIGAQLLRIDACVLAEHQVALAGGFIRDTYFGLKEPKDWDFAFAGMQPQDLLEVLRQYRTRSPGVITVTDKTKEGHYDESTGGGRIYMVLGVQEELPSGEVRDMDWILYAADRVEDALEKFDFCLNKFMAQYDENFSLSLHWTGAEWGVCTRNANSHIPPEREQRFKDMAEQLGWEYVDLGPHVDENLLEPWLYRGLK